MNRGDNMQVGIALRVERAHQGVVVHDVEPLHFVVSRDDMAELDGGGADAAALGVVEHVLPGHFAGRLAGGEQEHLVPGVLEAPGQPVDDQLDAAVQRRWNRCPRGRDDGDAHAPIES